MISKNRIEIKKNFYNNKCVIFTLLFFQVYINSLFAWSYHTHRMIASKCLLYLPPQIYSVFKPYKDVILQGSTDPDIIYKDFEAHVYHLYSKGLYTDAALQKINSLYSLLVDNLQKNNIASSAYLMGLLSHYISDINQPLHTAGKELDPDEDTYHETFEKDVQNMLSKVLLENINVEVTENIIITQKIESMALEANRHYTTIAYAYKRGNRIFDLQQIVQNQITASIVHTLEFWISALVRSKHFVCKNKYLILNQNLDSALVSQQSKQQIQFSLNNIRANSNFNFSNVELTNYSHTNNFINSYRYSNNNINSSTSKTTKKININKASYEELTSIPGIGEKRAKAIIEHRPYTSVYDIIKIEKNGRKLFNVSLLEKISDLLTTKDE